MCWGFSGVVQSKFPHGSHLSLVVMILTSPPAGATLQHLDLQHCTQVSDAAIRGLVTR
jgi:hypothetical protein